MEHQAFGKIVAALRKEQINFTNGNRWNQTDLAEETGLTPSLVGRIERGQQARLDGEILTQLARAFNLTSLERREFFAMASEVTDKEIVRTDLCNEEVFEQGAGVTGLSPNTRISHGPILRHHWRQSFIDRLPQYQPYQTSSGQVYFCRHQQSRLTSEPCLVLTTNTGTCLATHHSQQCAAMENDDPPLSTYAPFPTAVRRSVHLSRFSYALGSRQQSRTRHRRLQPVTQLYLHTRRA